MKELTELEAGVGNETRSCILNPCTSKSALFKTGKGRCLDNRGWSKVLQG